MHYGQSFEDMEEFAEKAHSKNATGSLYVNQTETAPNEIFFGDEDTGRSNVQQILSVLLETSEGSIFYEYRFFQPFDLEDAHDILEFVEKLFPKKVLDKDDFENKINVLSQK
ncbi:hypothetical protein [Lederbergia lenta]|uniref:Uncharacterized protein n=1 Tax=Lederbergia lenta TaxID=1467 RepID=A0A2X4WR80_LEDLE|nr:hypothetical protein [Lederbergia lenta]MEC2323882.1 hypothetical protein [Lederbergia lenta]SQI61132.1 Uncharacterised protein [Lederbergia lenta]